ncbi:MAG: preprotein translocase subunit YajC [Clostridia bacterium]|nr:preprotein translocase subunit YajC [Clostridia bacterium]
MLNSFLLAEGSNAASSWIMIGSFVLIAVVFYFVLIRPQRKQEKQANEMRNALQVGDEITTIGGIIGEIVSIKEETITIETSRDRTKIRFLRSAVRSVDVRAEDKNPALKKAAPAPVVTEEKSKKKGKGKIAPETPKADDKAPIADAPAAETPAEENAANN